MSDQRPTIGSVCVFCGSSNAVDRKMLEAASAFGRALARDGVRMVYGGGGVGLMGACARAAHDAGGRALGVMPDFLRQNEVLYDDVDTIVVRSMHERKSLMFEQSDAFAILPGGIGTLEEVVELMSWRRLGLHHKPIVFYSPGGFWQPLFALFQHTVDQKLTPPAFMDVWRAVDNVEAILPAMRELAADGDRETPGALPRLM